MRLRSDAKLRKWEFRSSYGFPIRGERAGGFKLGSESLTLTPLWWAELANVARDF